MRHHLAGFQCAAGRGVLQRTPSGFDECRELGFATLYGVIAAKAARVPRISERPDKPKKHLGE